MTPECNFLRIEQCSKLCVVPEYYVMYHVISCYIMLYPVNSCYNSTSIPIILMVDTPI